MIRQLIGIVCLAATASTQTRFDNALEVKFEGGGALRIHTESTLARSPISTGGVVAISEGSVSHRMVTDRQGKVLFAYDLSLAPVPNDRLAYTVRVQPHAPDHFMPQYVSFEPGDQFRVAVSGAADFTGSHTVRPDGNITIQAIGDVKAAGFSPAALAAELTKRLNGRLADSQVQVTVIAARRDYPTIAAAREFPAVRLGQAVNLDILTDRSTGERIFDVIQPVEPAEKSRRIAPQDEISLEQMRISINGTTLKEWRNSWMIGGAAKITLPGHGTVYLAVKPTASYAFHPVGRVDGGKLTFQVGNDLVEIVCKSNILKTSETGAVWVYHDSRPTQAVNVDVGMLEDLLPKR